MYKKIIMVLTLCLTGAFCYAFNGNETEKKGDGTPIAVIAKTSNHGGENSESMP